MPETPECYVRRSEFIRGLVQQPARQELLATAYAHRTPCTIVQFWHDLQDVPADVAECIASWASWTERGFSHRLFDERAARAFISRNLGESYTSAFDRCYHPAMQADLFRLCYLLTEGGFYVDADDVCRSASASSHAALRSCLDDGRLKLQPLCYDVASSTMVAPSVFRQTDAYSPHWIFYFNNNPLIARRGHPVIARALQRATALLNSTTGNTLPEIQSTTGPGNLSQSIVDCHIRGGHIERALVVLHEWDSLVVSRWPLSHRADSRNWRLSNQQHFHRNGE